MGLTLYFSITNEFTVSFLDRVVTRYNVSKK